MNTPTGTFTAGTFHVYFEYAALQTAGYLPYINMRFSVGTLIGSVTNISPITVSGIDYWDCTLSITSGTPQVITSTPIGVSFAGIANGCYFFAVTSIAGIVPGMKVTSSYINSGVPTLITDVQNNTSLNFKDMCAPVILINGSVTSTMFTSTALSIQKASAGQANIPLVNVTNLVVGMSVSGTGIPTGSTITSIKSQFSNTLTASQSNYIGYVPIPNYVTISNNISAELTAGQSITFSYPDAAVGDTTLYFNTSLSSVDFGNFVSNRNGITGAAGIPTSAYITSYTTNSVTLSTSLTATVVGGTTLTFTPTWPTGSTTLQLAGTVTNVSVGSTVTAASGIASNTTVTAMNGNTVTLSQGTTAVLTPNTTLTFGFNGSNTTAFNRVYRGFYILTDTYPGLATLMGFTATKAPILPTYTTSTGFPQHGYGITLNAAVTTISGGYITKYTLDTGYSSTTSCAFDTTSFATVSPYGVFTCQTRDYPNMDYPRNIYISIDQLITRNRCSNNKFTYGSVFSKIPTNQSFGNTILYEPYSLREIYIPGLQLDALTIRLYDDDGNPIQWNGGHWTVILNITYNIDVGSAGIEDASMGRTYRPYLKRTNHDPLETSREFAHKRLR